MKMIRTVDALAITGHDNIISLYKWVERWNGRKPNNLIIRRRGMVDAETLDKALIILSTPKPPAVSE